MLNKIKETQNYIFMPVTIGKLSAHAKVGGKIETNLRSKLCEYLKITSNYYISPIDRQDMLCK